MKIARAKEKYVVIDTVDHKAYITTDAGGVAQLFKVEVATVQEWFREGVRLYERDDYIIVKYPYKIKSRRNFQ